MNNHDSSQCPVSHAAPEESEPIDSYEPSEQCPADCWALVFDYLLLEDVLPIATTSKTIYEATLNPTIAGRTKIDLNPFVSLLLDPPSRSVLTPLKIPRQKDIERFVTTSRLVEVLSIPFWSDHLTDWIEKTKPRNLATVDLRRMNNLYYSFGSLSTLAIDVITSSVGQTLTNLSLMNLKTLENEALALISANAPNLTELNFTNCGKIDSQSALKELIGSLSKLNKLYIARTGVAKEFRFWEESWKRRNAQYLRVNAFDSQPLTGLNCFCGMCNEMLVDGGISRSYLKSPPTQRHIKFELFFDAKMSKGGKTRKAEFSMVNDVGQIVDLEIDEWGEMAEASGDGDGDGDGDDDDSSSIDQRSCNNLCHKKYGLFLFAKRGSFVDTKGFLWAAACGENLVEVEII